jgi:phage-related protein (TIGR01555 family)
MSARIVNVRPKPGFLMDASGEVIPARQNVVQFTRDRLTNAMSGMGTNADKRVGLFYNFMPIDGAQAEAGYRSSWLIRKIVDIPPLDMTRAWRDWQANADDIQKLEAEEKRLQVKMKCQRALVLARLYGGSALILGTNDADPMQPLRPEGTQKGGLTYVHVLSRWQLSHGPMIMDPASPWFGQPEYYEITANQAQNNVRLHPSRVIAFIGQKAPEGGFYQSMSWFWGDPIMQSIGEAVKNADLAQSGFASLIERASVDIIKMPDLMANTATEEGTQRVLNRLAAASTGKSNWRALLLDALEDWNQLQVNWSGIPAVMDSFILVVAGAADIPMTRLLGQSPKGLQSTGDGEERDYQSMIKARQDEQLAPALDRVDEMLIPSALGSKPSDIYYEFGPLQQENEKDGAEIELKLSQAFKNYSDIGSLPETALAKIMKNRMVESGRFPGSETAFEEAEAAGDDPLDPANQDPADLLTREQQVALLAKQGTVTPAQADALITDATPRSLYVSRKLLNGAEFIKWAKGQGFATTVPAEELHVTVLFSRTPVDWMKMGTGWEQDADGKLKVAAGGARLVEKLGDKGAVVLLFGSSALSWRHEDMVRNGASHDFDEYQPHVSITYEGSDVDLSKVESYRGELIFGPEIFAEVVDDWEQGLSEE